MAPFHSTPPCPINLTTGRPRPDRRRRARRRRDAGRTRAAVGVDARSGRDREWSGAADLVSHIPPLHIHPPESRLQYLNQGEQAGARDGHLNLNGRTRTDGHWAIFTQEISRRLRNRTTAAGIYFLRQRWVPPCPRHFPSGCPSS